MFFSRQTAPLIFCILISLCGSTKGMSDQTSDLINTSRNAAFTELKKDQPTLHGIVIDEHDKTSIYAISIKGRVTFDRMLQEKNDSTSILDLNLITSLKVEDRFYQSERHYKPGSHQLPFLKVSVTYLNNEVEEFLLPQSIVISGVTEKNNTRRAWPLSKIDELLVSHEVSNVELNYQELPEMAEEKGLTSAWLESAQNFLTAQLETLQFLFSF